jgi:endonuclease YncB( thermonuclease family)
VDGDTIYVNQTRLRLLSIDAFESAQNCQNDGMDYACGFEATVALIGLVKGHEVRCEGDRRDRYHRPLVHCWIGDLDLGREMVRMGWALAEFGSEYRADEESARAARLGAWAGTFERPLEWRKLHR